MRCLLIFSLSLFYQTRTAAGSGRITVGGNMEALSGVKILVHNDGFITTTVVSGYCIFDYLPPGPYELLAELNGFNTIRIDAVHIGTGEKV